MALTTTPYLDTLDVEIQSFWTQIGDWQVIDGEAIAQESGGDSQKVLYDTGETEHHVQITANLNSRGGRVMAYLRYIDENNYVMCESNSGLGRLIECVNGNANLVFTGNAAVPADGDFTISARAIGNFVRFKVAGLPQYTREINPALAGGTIIGFGDINYGRSISRICVALSDENTFPLAFNDGVPFPGASTADLTKPVITVSGLETTSITVGDALPVFTYSATDDKDGDITANVVVGGDTPDNTTIGTYTVTYNVSDTAGNAADEVTRTIHVLSESELPVTTLNMVFIGDSIGNHLGYSGGYFRNAANLLNCTATTYNNASGGSFARRMEYQLDAHLENAVEGGNNLFMMVVGTNNELDENGEVYADQLSEFIHYTSRIIAKVHNAGYKAIMPTKTRSLGENLSDFPTAGKIFEQVNICRDLTPEFYDDESGRPIVDFWEETYGQHSNGWFGDSYHPTELGEQKMLEYAANQLVPLIPEVFIKQSGLTVHAGDHQIVGYGAQVLLSGTATDTDGNAMTYTWDQVYGVDVGINNVIAKDISFTSPSADEQLIFRVSVSNGYDTDFSDVIVDVDGTVSVNQPPTANAGADQSVAAGATFTLDGSASIDTDGTIAEYRWTQTQGDTVTLDLTDPVRPVGVAPSTANAQTLAFSLVTVDDDGVESVADTVDIDVAAEVQNDVLSIIDKISFTFESDGMITAFPGRANRETFRLKPSEPTGLILDEGWFDFEANDVKRVEISILETTGVKIISSDTDSITIEKGKLHARMGDMPIKSTTKEFEPTVSVFVGADERGVVMTAPGLSGAPKVKYYATTARVI